MALVLGLVLGVAGLRRGDYALSVVFLLLAGLGAVGIHRVFRAARR